MTIADFQNQMRGSSISDVQLVGFVDQSETPLRFRPILQYAYFICGSLVLEMETIETTGSMRLTWVSEVRFKFELEDGMSPAIMSLCEQIMADPDSDNRLTSLCLWSPADVTDGIRCSAARFDLVNGQQIFADPSYHFGIRLGGPDQERRWMDTWPSANQAPVQVLTLNANQ